MLKTLISSMKSQLGTHSAMMIFCVLLMAGAFWGLAGGLGELGGLGTFAFLLPLAGCLVMHLVMHRFMGHGGHGKGREDKCDSDQENSGARRSIRPLARLEGSVPDSPNTSFSTMPGP